MRLVVFGQFPLVAEYLTRILVKLLALTHMKVGGTAANGKVLNRIVLSESMGYDSGVLLVLTYLYLLLVKPYVETKVALLKIRNIKVVYQHIRKDDAQQLGMIHAAKVQLYSYLAKLYQPAKSVEPVFGYFEKNLNFSKIRQF